MPRLVRQQPLGVRLKAYLDPWDWLLWVAEELNDDVYEEWLNTWATVIGVGLNLVFVLARGASNTGRSSSWSAKDDVFADGASAGSAWLGRFATTLVYILTLVCCTNALYTFFRRRHYRLFERDVNVQLQTPSARRVHVDSASPSTSALQYLQSLIAEATTPLSANPDAKRDVWELSIWDPKPFNITLFTLFSPGHLVLYYALLPPKTLDPRPSVTIITAILFAALFSLQLSFLANAFTRRERDSSLIHGEVMNEYDTKFVHPTLNKPVREVGTQTRESALTPRGTKTREVDTYTPTTIINRGFRTNPNQNYARLYDPKDSAVEHDVSLRRRSAVNGPSHRTGGQILVTPGTSRDDASEYSLAFTTPREPVSADFSSPLKPHHQRARERSPARYSVGGIRDANAMSQLRKTQSNNYLNVRSSTAGLAGSEGLRRTSGTDRRSASGRASEKFAGTTD